MQSLLRGMIELMGFGAAATMDLVSSKAARIPAALGVCLTTAAAGSCRSAGKGATHPLDQMLRTWSALLAPIARSVAGPRFRAA